MSGNPMQDVRIGKVTINIGTADDEQRQANAKRLLELVTGRRPTDAIAKKRLPEFKITRGKKIGAFVTIRGREIRPLLTKLIAAADKRISERSITNNSASFGIREYIDIQGIKYDPKIGMLGMSVNISFERKGLRVSRRKIRQRPVPKRHGTVTKREIVDYLTRKYEVNTSVEE